MVISEILQLEQKNDGTIILHKEGLFWKAYEKSAYLFVNFVKSYSVKKKYYKNINYELVYIGFPANSLDNIMQLLHANNVDTSEKQILISNFEFEEDKYAEWKKGIDKIYTEHSLQKTDIAGKIRDFQIVNKTPIECQSFLLELQNELNG
ncbi:MAG: hypothetical protein U9R54_02045 [Bacteroidota bacterium]|nr:hypothetical protein [Bacteroidota bacterium]